MAGFESGSSGVGSDRSANYVTTTAPYKHSFSAFHCISMQLIAAVVDVIKLFLEEI